VSARLEDGIEIGDVDLVEPGRVGERFTLHYIYCDWPGAEQAAHQAEIERFADSVDAQHLRSDGLRLIQASSQCKKLQKSGFLDSAVLENLC